MDAQHTAHYSRFKQDHASHIARLVPVIGGITEEAHWTLIDELKGTFGALAANLETDEAGQDAALSAAEQWVTSNCSSAGIEEDVAMALWLHGVNEGEAYLRANREATSSLVSA